MKKYISSLIILFSIVPIVSLYAIDFKKVKCISGNCVNGSGVSVNFYGDKYTGMFKNSLYDGNGILTREDESVIYSGEWKEGYIILNNDVIIDKEHNLMWQKVSIDDVTYSNLKDFCTYIKIGKYDDWHVPSIDELKILRKSNYYKDIQTKGLLWSHDVRYNNAGAGNFYYTHYAFDLMSNKEVEQNLAREIRADSVVVDDNIQSVCFVRNINSNKKNEKLLNTLDAKKINELLDDGADVNFAGYPCNRTALHNASISGNEEIAKLLLEKNANINAIDEDGNTPLLVALNANHYNTAIFLIKAGANINIKNRSDVGAINMAVDQPESLELLQLLIKKGTDLNNSVRGTTPLMGALHNDASRTDRSYKQIIKTLLDAKADVNCRDRDGRTALMYLVASEMNFPDAIDILQMLIKSNADLNLKDRQDSNGRTVLKLAKDKEKECGNEETKKRYKQIIKILEKAGAKE